jgi:NAD(P)H dehydrogenase (quinone)
MILITGSSGKTGKAILKALAAKREPVRAFVRSESRAEELKSLGATEIAVGDLHDQSALRRAMEGVRALYHICPNVNPDEVAIGRAAIAAAQQSDVAQFVYHSVLHSQAEAMSHHWNKLRVEEALFESGLAFTILQPTAYMQNILGSWASIIDRGIYPVPYPVETQLSLVHLDDVAEVAANVLTELGHARAIYELVGTRGLAQTEVAEMLSAALGKPVRAEQVYLTDWEARVRTSGMGIYEIQTLLNMFKYYAQFGMSGNPNVLGWLLRRAPTTFQAFAEHAA